MMVIQLPMVFVLVLIDDVGVNPDDVDGGVGGANTVSAGAIADRCDGDMISVSFSDDVSVLMMLILLMVLLILMMSLLMSLMVSLMLLLIVIGVASRLHSIQYGHCQVNQ